MLFTVIRKEILLNLVSFRFQVSVVLLAVLVIGSMLMMTANYTRRVAEYSDKRMNTRPEFEAFGVTKDPKPTLLGIFSIGLEKQMSRSVMIPGFAMGGDDRGDPRRSMYATSKLIGIMPEASKYSNPIFTLFMPPDFVYVVNIVLSLLALLFSFDTICGEKEDQTLKLMLTNSVPRDVVLLGKWIGGTISILFPFVVSFGLGILLVSLNPSIAFTDEAVTRIILIFFASMMYISVFFLMGMVFSVFTSRSSTSLILSLFAWVFFVLVIPNLAPVIARQVVPMKTSDQIVLQAENMSREMEGRIRDLPPNDEGRKKKIERIRKELPEKIRELENLWLNALERQTNLAMNISRISPSADFIYILASLSGTGVQDYNKQREEIFRYRDYLAQRRDKFLKNDNSKPIPMLYIKVDTEKVPEFRNRRLDIDASFNNIISDFAILFIYLAIFFQISFIKFLNYDVK